MVRDTLFHFGILSPRVSKAFEKLTKVWFKFKIFPALIIYDRYNVAWYVIDMVPVMYVFVCMNVGYIYIYIVLLWLLCFHDWLYHRTLIWPERSFIGSADSEDELQHDHVEYQRIQNNCTMPWFRWESSRQPLSGLRNRAIWIWQRPWRSWRWSNSLGGNGWQFTTKIPQVQIMLLVIIGWDAPPLSSSHHQDYPIFRRSRTRPSLGTVASQVICRKMVLLFVKLVFVEIW